MLIFIKKFPRFEDVNQSQVSKLCLHTGALYLLAVGSAQCIEDLARSQLLIILFHLLPVSLSLSLTVIICRCSMISSRFFVVVFRAFVISAPTYVLFFQPGLHAGLFMRVKRVILYCLIFGIFCSLSLSSDQELFC